LRWGRAGKGSNQAVAAGKLGADVSIISCLGDDDFGQMALQTWQDANVKPVVIQTKSAYTGAAFIFVDARSGDNAIIISPGVAAEITPSIITENHALIASADVFITQLEQPIDTAYAGLKLAKEHGNITILNPAPAAELPEDIFALCDYLTPNETETEAITGLSSPHRKRRRNCRRSAGKKRRQNSHYHDGGAGRIPLWARDGTCH
jgi:ribokinase